MVVFLFRFLLVFLLSCESLMLAAHAEERHSDFVVYGADFTDGKRINPLFEPTIEAIRRAVYPQKVLVRTANWQELDHAIREKKASLIIGGASVYRRNIRSGLRDIATAVTPLCPDPDHSMGTVLYALKQDERIENLADLKDKIFTTNAAGAYRGELIPKKEILDAGFDPNHFFKKTIYLSDPWERLKALEDGRADVLAVDACFAEEMKAAGHDFTANLKVINQKENPYSNCVTSTALYPGYSILIPATLDVQTIKKISQEIRSEKYPDGYGWTLASDFTKADELYKTLKIGPFEYLNRTSLEQFFETYKTYISVAATILLMLLIQHFRLRALVGKRTGQLRSAYEREEKLRQKTFAIEARYRRLKQDQEVSQLCSSIAHDLSQPLSSVLLYSGVLSKQIRNRSSKTPLDETKILEVLEKIRNRTEQMNRVIQSIRNFCRSSLKLELVDPNQIFAESVKDYLALENLPENNVEIKSDIGDSKIYASSDQLRLAFMNILMNSGQAVQASKTQKIFVELKSVKEQIEIRVWDTGPRLSDEQLKNIRNRVASEKSSSSSHLGIGLNIIESIVCLNSGILDLVRSRLGGLMVVMLFPKASE